MVGTNSVRKRTGNISVGTSAFSMVVLDQPLKQVHRDIDMVMTPDGSPVAMVHTNNCSSDINAWANLFNEFAARLGVSLAPDRLYETLFLEATHADQDAGGLINYSYLSGENVTKSRLVAHYLSDNRIATSTYPTLFKPNYMQPLHRLKLGWISW